MISRQRTLAQQTIAQSRPARFAGNWVAGPADSRSLRRRLMAALRMTHRSLGLKRDRLGLGALGVGGVGGALLAAIGIMTPQAAFAQVAIGNGVISNPANCTNPSAATSGSTALGCAANAAGPNATAIGWGTNANGQNSLAIGDANSATGDGSIIIGYSNAANGLNAIGMGVFANATGINALAVGGNAHAIGEGASAFGVNAVANAGAATAIGNGSVSSGLSSTALGQGAQATVDFATAVGRGAQATNNATTAFGNFARAQGNSALALGAQAQAIGDSTVAVGQGAGAGSTAGNSGSVAAGIAAGTLVSGAQNTAMGGGIASVMRGAGSGVTGARNVALGTGDGSVTYDGTLQASAGNLVSGSDNIAIGTNAGIGVSANATTSIGWNANAAADDSIAMGTNTIASDSNAVAIGYQSTATAVNSVYLGARTAAGTGALAESAIAIGTDVIASQVDAIAIGRASVAAGDGANAIGVSSSATGLSSAAIGRTANASGDFALALGNAAVSSGTGSVAMGSGAQGINLRTIAVGNNAAAGAADAIALGTGAQATGANSISIGKNNVVSGANSVAIGDPSTITGSGSYSLGNNNTINANNAFVVGSGVTVATGLDGVVVLGNGSTVSAAVPTPNTVIGGTTYTFAGGAPAAGDVVSVGSAAKPRQIQNVAAGRISGTSTDAINGSQLFATNQAVDSLVTTVNNINVGGGIKYFHANSTLADSLALGTDSVAIGPNAVANNAGDVAIGLNAVSGPTTNVGGATIGGTAYTFAGGTPSGAFSVGRPGAERQIQNVAAGRLSNSSTDAVNGSQLFATNQQVTQNTTDIANLDGSVTNLGNTVTNLGDTINNIAGDTSTTYTDANGDGIRYVRTNDTTLPVTDSFAQGIGSSAVGYQATAVADDSLALGRASNSSILGGVALGSGSVSDRPIAQGNGNLPGTLVPFHTDDRTLLGAVSVGNSTSYRQITNVADGTEDQDAVTIRQLKGALDSFAVTATKYFHANSAASDSAAIGAESVAIGPQTTVNGDSGIGMGNGAIVQMNAPGGIAIGQTSTVNLADGVALGNGSTSNGIQAMALGTNAVADDPGSVALGAGSTTDAAVQTPNTVIAGATYNFAGINPTSTVSIGAPGAERTLTNVAAGRISGSSTDAVNGSQLFATNQAVDILNTTVTNITTGGGIKYFHANSTLPDSVAAGTDSVAIGPNAVASNAGDVAIGLNSVSGTTTAVGSGVIGGTTYTFAGGTPAGAFSVGAAGKERQIQNVAAGQLSGTSTDAVNGSQLFATNQQVTKNTTDIANLDGDVTNLGNTVTNLAGDVTNIGDTLNNIAGDTSTAYTDANGDGIRYVRTSDRTLPVTDSFAQGIGSTAVGYQATAAADGSLALGRGTNVTIEGGVALGSGSVSDRPIAPISGSIISGTGIIPYNTTDLNLLGAISVGDATHYRQITNVADGTEDQDAVSLRQLKGALSSFAVTGTKYFHANSAASDSAAVGAESVAIGPETTVNGDNGIGMGNHAIVQQTAPGGIAIGQNSTVNLADGIALGTGSTANGIQATAIGAGATANEPGSVALGAGSTTAAAVATTGVTIKGVDYAFAGTNPTSTVSVGSVGNERTVTNVAAGRISATSTDAINGSQLYATNQAIESLSTGVGDLNEFAVQYTKNADGSKSNAITLVGGDVNAPVVIHNVAEGRAPTDAVNVSQLQTTLTDSKNYTNQVASTTLQTANAYTDSKFAQLNMDLDGIRSEAHQAAAVGLAAASLRYDDRPGKLSVAVGGGYWQDEGAFAFGAGYTSESGRVRANLSGTTTDGKWGVGAGLSVTLN